MMAAAAVTAYPLAIRSAAEAEALPSIGSKVCLVVVSALCFPMALLSSLK